MLNDEKHSTHTTLIDCPISGKWLVGALAGVEGVPQHQFFNQLHEVRQNERPIRTKVLFADCRTCVGQRAADWKSGYCSVLSHWLINF
jgi:hypothetical protein